MIPAFVQVKNFWEIQKKGLTNSSFRAIILKLLAVANVFVVKLLAMANNKLFILKQVIFMNLTVAEVGKEYIIQRIGTDDDELNAFLFSLGCYSGEPITVVSRRKGGCTVSIKDGRYNIDSQLAETIII